MATCNVATCIAAAALDGAGIYATDNNKVSAFVPAGGAETVIGPTVEHEQDGLLRLRTQSPPVVQQPDFDIILDEIARAWLAAWHDVGAD